MIWRWLETWDGAPGYQMALDEALLLSRTSEPALRFYTWKPSALSLGYFQRFADVHEVERSARIVRRLTGGGAIHHEDELTFAIAAPLGDPLYRGPVSESYARVHGALAAALLPLGVHASLREEERARSDRPASGMCFHRSTSIDLVWDGRKGVGSAQRRTRGRVLHHGSIKLGGSPLEPGVATVRASAPDVTPHQLAELVRTAFTAHFGIGFERREPTREELSHAQDRADFFESAAWVRRR